MLESRFYRILDEVTSVVIINFLFILSSLLIVTLFPALFAMIYTIKNKLANKSSELIRYFFKELWKYKFSANLIGIPASLIGFSLFYYNYAFMTMETNWNLYLLPISFTIFIIYIFFIFQAVFTYIHFQMSVKQWIKYSFLFSFYKPHFTLLFGLYLFVIFLLTYHFPILFFLVAFSLPTYGLVYMSLTKLSSIPTKD